MFSMARGLFPDSLTKICDLTNTPNAHPLLVCLSVKMYLEGTFVKMYYYVSKGTMVLTEILLLGNT